MPSAAPPGFASPPSAPPASASPSDTNHPDASKSHANSPFLPCSTPNRQEITKLFATDTKSNNSTIQRITTAQYQSHNKFIQSINNILKQTQTATRTTCGGLRELFYVFFLLRWGIQQRTIANFIHEFR